MKFIQKIKAKIKNKLYALKLLWPPLVCYKNLIKEGRLDKDSICIGIIIEKYKDGRRIRKVNYKCSMCRHFKWNKEYIKRNDKDSKEKIIMPYNMRADEYEKN